MAKKSYFGNRISPSCSYCLFGNRSREGNKVLCEKQGLVDADYSCKKWSMILSSVFQRNSLTFQIRKTMLSDT